MKNRLQFRYHTDIFFNRDLAYEYLHETINNQYDARSFSSLIAEPLVSYYYDEKGNIVPLFMIGMGGNGTQPINDNVKYFIIDAAKIEEDIKTLKEVSNLHEEKLLELEQGLQLEIERATKKEQDLEAGINKLIKNLETEIASRRAVDGQLGPQYQSNKGTTSEPIYFIDDAKSLNDADKKLDAAIKMVEQKSLVNVKVNGINGNVKENISSVTIGGKDIQLSEYKKATKSHPVTSNDTINDAFGKIQMQIDTIQDGVGLNSDGSYNKNVSTTYINGAENIHNATEILDEVITNIYGGEPIPGIETIHEIGYAIQNEASQRIKQYEQLSGMINKNSADINTINTYSVNHKPIKSNPIINGADILLDNYIASSSVSNVTPNDNVNNAIGKLETRTKNVQSELDAEIIRATNAENKLTNDVTTLIGDVKILETNVNINENNIINVRNDLNNEIMRSTNEETRLENKIDTNSSNIVNLQNNLKTLSSTVATNKIVNRDGSISLYQTSDGTDLSVNVKDGDNALKLGTEGLYVDIKAYTDYKGENAIAISDRNSSNMRTISLKINTYDNILTNDGAGLKVNINMEYDDEAKRIYLLDKDINGKAVVLSEINTSDFVKDGMIKKVSYDENSKVLTIVWNADSTGTKEEIETKIDLSNLISVYTPGNGLRLDGNNSFHVVVDLEGCDKIGNIPVLATSENGVKVVGVVNAIEDLSDKFNFNSDLISAESKRAKDAESALTLTIQYETSRALGVETQIQKTILDEEKTRENADNVLDNKITTISGHVVTLQSELNTNVDALNSEITRATIEENKLSKNIESEASVRESHDIILTDKITAVSGHVMTLQNNVDANKKLISDEITRSKIAEGAINDKVIANKDSIDLLNGNYTETGSIKHYIVDAMVADIVNPTAGEAIYQTLLRRIEGEGKIYASNSTNDMMHNNRVLSDVINTVTGQTSENTNEIKSLKNRIAELEKFKEDAEYRIAILESKINESTNFYVQTIKEVISNVLIGTDTEIKVNTIYNDTEDGNRVIDKIQVGFADDAIFNSSL